VEFSTDAIGNPVPTSYAAAAYPIVNLLFGSVTSWIKLVAELAGMGFPPLFKSFVGQYCTGRPSAMSVSPFQLELSSRLFPGPST
jgi:hypothetical protein